MLLRFASNIDETRYPFIAYQITDRLIRSSIAVIHSVGIH